VSLQRPQPGSLAGHSLALSLALVGGVLGVIGAFFQEVRGGGLLIAFAGAPMIEEVLKPAGVYILLIRWPHLLPSQLYNAGLAAISGLSFGIIESAIYVNVYFPEHSSQLVVYRFTVPLLMHTMTSFIVGFGINQRLLASVRGEIPLLAGNRRFFITGIVLHALFNITATVLWAVGVLDLE